MDLGSISEAFETPGFAQLVTGFLSTLLVGGSAASVDLTWPIPSPF